MYLIPFNIVLYIFFRDFGTGTQVYICFIDLGCVSCMVLFVSTEHSLIMFYQFIFAQIIPFIFNIII